jgi:hypothetical protein
MTTAVLSVWLYPPVQFHLGKGPRGGLQGIPPQVQYFCRGPEDDGLALPQFLSSRKFMRVREDEASDLFESLPPELDVSQIGATATAGSLADLAVNLAARLVVDDEALHPLGDPNADAAGDDADDDGELAEPEPEGADEADQQPIPTARRGSLQWRAGLRGDHLPELAAATEATGVDAGRLLVRRLRTPMVMRVNTANWPMKLEVAAYAALLYAGATTK